MYTGDCQKLALPNFKVMAQTKYASKLKVGKDYVFAPGGFSLDYDRLVEMWPYNRCFLVALDERQLDVLHKHLAAFARWQWLWGFGPRSHWDAATKQKWDEVEAFVAELEFCLMAGCDVQELIITQRLIVGALTGQVVDLDQPLPTSGTVDYSANGISPQLRHDGQSLAEITKDAADQHHSDFNAIRDAIAALGTKLDELEITIQAGEDLEDDLAAVWGALNTITTILGATVGTPPAPL